MSTIIVLNFDMKLNTDNMLLLNNNVEQQQTVKK